MSKEVDDFLAHAGVKGMKWGKRKAQDTSTKTKKAPSAGKQRDMDIKAARQRVNSGKNLAVKMLNADSFGKPLGGRQMLDLYNPKGNKSDLDLASQMTRGQKAAVRIAAGAAVAYGIGSLMSR